MIFNLTEGRGPAGRHLKQEEGGLPEALARTASLLLLARSREGLHTPRPLPQAPGLRLLFCFSSPAFPAWLPARTSPWASLSCCMSLALSTLSNSPPLSPVWRREDPQGAHRPHGARQSAQLPFRGPGPQLIVSETRITPVRKSKREKGFFSHLPAPFLVLSCFSSRQSISSVNGHVCLEIQGGGKRTQIDFLSDDFTSGQCRLSWSKGL